jgi:peptidoglycan/LPS O-acetylase OafA/YrhL
MTIQPTKKLHKQRLIGLDLCRGMAAYAVVVIHAYALMSYINLPTNNSMAMLTQISRFAVPFFLAVSFYFMTNKIYVSEKSFSIRANFNLRFTRLLIPYLSWSVIYLSLRLVKALSTPDGLKIVLQDPVGLVFLGSASVHLYFLPLLFSGSFLIVVADRLARRRINIKALFFLLIMSIIAYELMIRSGNHFHLGTNCLGNISACSSAFGTFIKSMLPNLSENQVLRLLMVEIAWIVQCLPYVFIGMIFNHPSIEKNILEFKSNHKMIFYASTSLFFCLSILGVLSVFKILYFPKALYEIGTGTTLFIFGIFISPNWQTHRLIEDVGKCSFGIYLMHYLVLLIYVPIMNRILSEVVAVSPTLIMLTLTTLSFITSWAITSILIGRKTISRLLFGI